MGTPNDQTVLQAIFNPDTPFGDLTGLDVGDEVEEEVDEGELDLGLQHSTLAGLRGVAEDGGPTRPPLFHNPWTVIEAGVRKGC